MPAYEMTGKTATRWCRSCDRIVPHDEYSNAEFPTIREKVGWGIATLGVLPLLDAITGADRYLRCQRCGEDTEL